MVGPILVNATGGRSVRVLFQEGAFEKNLAACAAAIALAAPQRKSSDDLFLAEIRADETAELTLRLAGTKLCIFDRARAFRRARRSSNERCRVGATLTRVFHKVRVRR